MKWSLHVVNNEQNAEEEENMELGEHQDQTEIVLEMLGGKTIEKAIPRYVGEEDLYLIELHFTDGSKVEIDNEHRAVRVLQARFVK